MVEMVDAVTKYLAQRLIERERALADNSAPVIRDLKRQAGFERRRRRRRAIRAFVFGLLAGLRHADRRGDLFPGSHPLIARRRARRLSSITPATVAGEAAAEWVQRHVPALRDRSG